MVNVLAVIQLLVTIFTIITIPVYLIFLFILFKYRADPDLSGSFFKILISAGIGDILSSSVIIYMYTYLAVVPLDQSTVHMLIDTCYAHCPLVLYLHYATSFCSIYHIVSMAINRYTATYKPLDHEYIWQTKHRLSILILLSWFLPFVCALPTFLVDVQMFTNWTDPATDRVSRLGYDMLGPYRHAVMGSAALIGVLSTFALILIYSAIVSKVRKTWKQQKKQSAISVTMSSSYLRSQRAAIRVTRLSAILTIPIAVGSALVFRLAMGNFPEFTFWYQVATSMSICQNPYLVTYMCLSVRAKWKLLFCKGSKIEPKISLVNRKR